MMQQRLGSSTKDDCAAALLNEEIQRIVQKVDTPDGEGLNFIEDQDRVGHLVHSPDRPRA